MFTEKEIHGVWGMVGVHWTVWNGRFISSCSIVVVLACPHLPCLRYILCLNSVMTCPHIPLKWLVHDLMLQWLWRWFAFISRLSDTCSAYLSHDVLKFQFLRRVICTTAAQIRAQFFSQLKTVGRAETFVSWPSEKGVNSKWNTKKKTCPWLIGWRLSQR